MDYIKIGKIVNTHGIKGEVRLLSKFPYKDKVFVKDMIIYIDKKYKEVINSYRKHKNFDMITLVGYNNINDVLKYKGLNVYVNKDDIMLDNNKYLDDDRFTKAFIKDKLNFTNWGDYKIKNELKRLGVNEEIIYNNISNIDNNIYYERISKIIDKDISTNKKYNGIKLKNKIYNHLLTLGYSKEKVISIINNYNF